MKETQGELFPENGNDSIEQSLHTSDYHENKTFIEMHISKICGYTFSSCVFKGCLFIQTDFTDVTFEDCLLEDCQLSLCKINGTIFNNISFMECRLTGINFTDSSDFCFTPQFSNSLLDNCVFYNNLLSKLRFTDTSFRDCDFSNTAMKQTVFENVRFQTCNFLGCNMEKADFRSATGYTIDPSANKLKGTRFSLPEARSFFKYIGITVE